jgi:hypothetical protein
VKLLSGSGAALALLAPMALMLALVMGPVGCGGGSSSSSTPTPTMGPVEVGFVDSSSGGYQQLLLNVLAVRINPNSNPSIGDNDKDWVDIGVSPGLGSEGELQVDLANLQDQVQLLGTAQVPAQKYRQVQLELDPNNVGQIVPNCPQAPSGDEGCVHYPLTLETLNAIRAPAGLEVVNGHLSPLIIDVNPGTITPPKKSSGFYGIDLSISVPDASQYLGEVHGSVAGVPSRDIANVRAELRGTNQLAGSAQVLSGFYTLLLPAQSSSAGTLYDIFIHGNGVEYSAAAGVPITRGGITARNFTVAGAQTGFIGGRITDVNTGLGIPGATLTLLISPAGQGVDCGSNPGDCVVVASASTDDQGNYPLAGTVSSPAYFNIVPLGTYTLQVTAAGYDPVITTAPLITAGAYSVCGQHNQSTTDCSFSLNSTTISGTVSIDSPPAAGSDVEALVMAEDTGTNNLENVTMVIIPSGATSVPYMLTVPTKVASFDLFASAQDFFDGRVSPFPGHTIEVLSNVTGGSTGQDFAALDCVGHGTLSGEVAVTPDSGTTVMLSKADAQSGANVQLMESQVGPSMSATAGQFSFCAPPDTYTVQRYEAGVPASQPTTVVIPEPPPTTTECPHFCGFADGSCPSACTITPLIDPL